MFQRVKNSNGFNTGNIVDTFGWIPSLPQKLEVRDSFDKIKVLSLSLCKESVRLFLRL